MNWPRSFRLLLSRKPPSRLARVPDPPCSTPPFPDVPCSYWARPHIQYVLLEGVTQGYPDGNYYPKQICTRAEMAVFIARAFRLSM